MVYKFYGSSPRMRGTGNCFGAARGLWGFIPAHAGNRSVRPVRWQSHSVHPRACGEQKRSFGSWQQHVGSSPRMRGTGRHGRGSLRQGRFIPAHAGNRTQPPRCAACSAVHPRACGEQKSFGGGNREDGGSSPRMWGTDQPANNESVATRFIPAHAGNSLSPRPTWLLPAVHPRACGEQRLTRFMEFVNCGSSPRMRGTAHRHSLPRPVVRFIPAHAGNSRATQRQLQRHTVHPRACGEQHTSATRHGFWTGSSPRMRGTDAAISGSAIRSRFIPAHAGNSNFKAVARFWEAVHPRACGEQTTKCDFAYYSAGSSPRMRGTGRPGVGCDADRRFIPAHAGNSAYRSRAVRPRAVHPRACGEQRSR